MKKALLIAAAVLLIGLGLPTAAVAGGGCARGGTGPKSQKVVDGKIALANICFTPSTAWVTPGTTVTWINNDEVEHNIAGPGLTINSDSLLPGKKYSLKFPSTGIYPYACSLHYAMAGVVVVGAPVAPTTVSDIAPPVEPPPPPAPPAQPAAAVKTNSATGAVAVSSLIAAAVAAMIGFSAGRLRRPVSPPGFAAK